MTAQGYAFTDENPVRKYIGCRDLKRLGQTNGIAPARAALRGAMEGEDIGV
jgi:hypothetical protein